MGRMSESEPHLPNVDLFWTFVNIPERVLAERMEGFRPGAVDRESGHLVSGSNRATNCDLKQI